MDEKRRNVMDEKRRNVMDEKRLFYGKKNYLAHTSTYWYVPVYTSMYLYVRI